MQIPRAPAWRFWLRFGICTFRTTTGRSMNLMGKKHWAREHETRNEAEVRASLPGPLETKRVTKIEWYAFSNDETFLCLRNMESSIKHVSYWHNFQIKFHCLSPLYLQQCTCCVHISRNAFLWLMFKPTNALFTSPLCIEQHIKLYLSWETDLSL